MSVISAVNPRYSNFKQSLKESLMCKEIIQLSYYEICCKSIQNDLKSLLECDGEIKSDRLSQLLQVVKQLICKYKKDTKKFENAYKTKERNKKEAQLFFKETMNHYQSKKALLEKQIILMQKHIQREEASGKNAYVPHPPPNHVFSKLNTQKLQEYLKKNSLQSKLLRQAELRATIEMISWKENCLLNLKGHNCWAVYLRCNEVWVKQKIINDGANNQLQSIRSKNKNLLLVSKQIQQYIKKYQDSMKMLRLQEQFKKKGKLNSPTEYKKYMNYLRSQLPTVFLEKLPLRNWSKSMENLNESQFYQQCESSQSYSKQSQSESLEDHCKYLVSDRFFN